MSKITIDKDAAIIDDADDFISKLITGCQGTITIKSPFISGGKREITKVKDKNGKEIGKGKK